MTFYWMNFDDVVLVDGRGSEEFSLQMNDETSFLPEIH